MIKKDCKCKELGWVSEGDKRLECKKCKKKFVMVNGEIIPL